MGRLDTCNTRVLNTLRAAAPSLRLKIFVSENASGLSHKAVTDASFAVEVVVYGDISDIGHVNSLLSDAKIFLQEPEHLDSAVEYRNPHVLSWEDSSRTPRFRLELDSCGASFEDEIEDIIEGTKAFSTDSEVIQDPKICSILRRLVEL